jgi:structural maintenance of chromosome 4
MWRSPTWASRRPRSLRGVVNTVDEDFLEYLEDIIEMNQYVEKIEEANKQLEVINEKRTASVQMLKLAEKGKRYMLKELLLLK